MSCAAEGRGYEHHISALYGGDVRDAKKLEGKSSMTISEGFIYNEKFIYHA
jgi:hypothetical protein